jgi:hypothetical protein
MDLKNFDKQIKSSLENLEAPFDPGSWSALEQRMNSAFSEEQPAAVEPVDLVVKRTLERMEAPYHSAHWNLLNARLNQEILVRRLRMSKVAEVAIFLLLLANVEGFLGGFKAVVAPPAPAAPKAIQPMAAIQKAKKSGKKSAVASPSASVVALAEKMASMLTAPFETGSEGLENAVVITNVNAGIPSGTSNNLLDGANFYNQSGMVPFHKLEKLPQAKTAEFAWKKFLESIPGVITPTPRKANGLYAASFAAIEQNKFSADNFSTTSNGFGAGVAVGYRKGKWGVETGITYSNKNFTPKKEVDFYAGNPVDGFLGNYITDVNADVFSVPVKVTRRMARIGRTSAHAVAGITAHVATEKRFTSKTSYFPPASPSGPVVDIDPTQFPAPDIQNKGALEGGSAQTNAFASLDLGFRLEHALGKRYIAFVEPSYRRSLGGGFGPKRERVNTLGLQAGVMAAL